MMKLIMTKKHKYKLGKRELRSVTDFVSSFFNKFNSKEVARKLSKFPVNRQAKRGVRYWLRKWKEEQQLGTEVHCILEHKFKNTGVTGTSNIGQEIAEKAYNKVQKELVEKIKPEIISTEMKMWDEDLGLAGTADLVMFKKDKIYLVDWKVTKKISTEGYEGLKAKEPIGYMDDCNYNKYTLQLSMYAYILEKQGKKKIKNLYLIHCTRDGVTILDVPYEIDIILRLIEHEKNNKRRNE